jgi:hypothetical protein
MTLATRTALLAAAVVFTAANALAGERYAVVITGVSGDVKYAQRYEQWRTRLVTALVETHHFSRDHIEVLGERPAPGVGLASRDEVGRTLGRLRQRLREDDLLMVVLIGHGSYDGATAKFNLVGPDLDVGEWDQLLRGMPGRLVFADTASCSLLFLQRLAAKNRVLISATDQAAETYETVFPEYFVKALEDPDETDADKDGRLSIWEVFAAASRGVQRWYEQRGQIATEHSLLDELGDGVGKDAAQPGIDTRVAETIYLDPDLAALAPADANGNALEHRRTELLAEISRLRAQKPAMSADDYATNLETLLVELARLSRELRKRTSSPQDPARAPRQGGPSV